jgi:tetratricopeptide (TPR) repeat protein
MRPAWILPTVLLGMGLGWVCAALYYSDNGADVVSPPIPAAKRPGPRSVSASEPSLIGSPPPPVTEAGSVVVRPPVPPPVVPTPEDLDVIEFIGPDGIEDLVEFEPPPGIPPPTEHRGWNALLTIYALGGRADDFDRTARKALEAGFPHNNLLEILQLLPREHHVSVLDRLLVDYPVDVWPAPLLADLFTAAGAGERAVDVLLPALEASADAGLASRLVAADPVRAARVLYAMASADDWDGELLGDVGEAFVAQGRGDLALPFLQEALTRQPDSRDVLTALRGVDPTLALEHVRGLTETQPERSDVWTWLGEMELEEGNREASFVAYLEAARLSLTTDVLYGLMRADPDRAYASAVPLVTEETGDEVLGAVAKLALKGGLREDAASTLLRAHEQDPTDNEWMVAMVALDPKGTADVLRRTAAGYSGDSRDEIVGALGNALRELGRPGEAYEQYRVAHELDPSDWEWQRGLARSAPARALTILEARLESAGEEGDLLGAIGDAYAGTGQREQALAFYERAIAAGGGDEWWARVGLMDGERGLAGLQERIRETPDAAEAWSALGELHEALGNVDEARAAYDRARTLNPTSLLLEIRYRDLGG